MAAECFSVAWLETIRVTEVDICGVPQGPFVTSDGTVSVSVSAETEDGVEVFQRKSNGQTCINRKQVDTLKRYMTSIDWCEVNPYVFELVAGARPELDGEDVVGYRPVTGALNTSWALEGWTQLGGDPCDAGGAFYGYFLFPLLRGGLIGDFELGAEATTFTTEGSFTQAGDGWDVGPYDVIGTPAVPTPLDLPMLSDEPFLHRLTQVPPPDVVCDIQETSPTSP